MTPVAAAEAALAADRRHADPAIWITRVSHYELMARARALETEGPRDRPLWGRTFAVTDTIDVADLPTTAACPGYEYTPAATAPAVQHLLDAGALLLGKTNLDQFAAGLAGTRSPYGVPRNVFDRACVPGGASSGAAVAVAVGIADFALGTDADGAGRVPAMFGNIVGLKPTRGAVSTTGTVPTLRSIDTISVFAPTARAAMTVLRLIARPDPDDRYSRTAPDAYLQTPPLPNTHLAIADIAPLCAPEIAEAYRQAAALFPTTQIDLAPYLALGRLLDDGPWRAERTAALRPILHNHPHYLHEVTRRVLMAGLSHTATEAFDALHQRAETRRLAARLFQTVDALLLPTAPFTPTLAELAADPFAPNTRLATFTSFVNLCDLAALSVPCGRDRDGRPTGVTLIGPAFSEGRLASIAERIERRWPNEKASKEAVLF